MSDLAIFRRETRSWLAENCPSNVRKPGYIPIGSSKIELEPNTKLWLDRMVEKGWTTPTWPKEYGGANLNKEEYRILIEELSRINARPPLTGRSVNYIGPTIFKNVPNETDLSQNEVFGPVVSTQSWVEEEEVIKIANDTIYGLAAGIWSKDVAKAMRIANRIEAGTVYINNYFNASTQSPVGGFKQSGYGRENGWEGMRCFMQTKSVWLSTSPSENNPFV